MRVCLACVSAILVSVVPCLCAPDAAQATWRWWFLAETADSTTLEMYDRIESQYLETSDLNVLRYELSALFRQYSREVSSVSEAQQAALLIRLFHYSASRPAKAAEQCLAVAQQLSSYLRDSKAQSELTDRAKADLSVAVDIGMNCFTSMFSTYGLQDRVDIVDIVNVVDARWQLMSADTLLAARSLIQAVDGITAAVGYGGLLDTILCRDVYRQVLPYFNAIYRYCSTRTEEQGAQFIRRHLLLLESRIAELAEPAQAESQILAYSYALSKLKDRVVYPELRMRANALRYHFVNAGTSIEMNLMFNGVIDTALNKMIQLLELSLPGSSSTFFSPSLISYAQAMPVRGLTLSDTLVHRIHTRLRSVIGNEYDSNFVLHYRTSDQFISNANRRITTSYNAAADDIVYDRYYALRLARMYEAIGMTDEARNAAFSVIVQHAGAYSDPFLTFIVSHWLLYESQSIECLYADPSMRSSALDSLITSLHLVIINNSVHQAKSILSHRSSWMAGIQVNHLRNEHLNSLNKLLGDERATGTDKQSLMVLNLQSRSGVTRYARHRQKRVRLRELLQMSGPIPRQRVEVKQLVREQLEAKELAQYAHGEKSIDSYCVNQLQLLNAAMAGYYRIHQYGVQDDASVYTSEWQPDSLTIYVVTDRYSDNQLHSDGAVDAQNWPYRWCVSALSIDTVISKWGIHDSLMVHSLSVKQRDMQYGINSSTHYDSLVLSLVAEMDPSQQFKRIVFLPADYLYCYNPYLIHSGSDLLCSRYRIEVAAAVGPEVQLPELRSMAILAPRPSGLNHAEAEERNITKMMRSRGWDVNIISEAVDERTLANELEGVELLHVTSHALQGDLIGVSERDVSKRELLFKDEIGTVARRSLSSLLQYSRSCRGSGAVFGDGLLSPIELEVYNGATPRLVYLSTCQTIGLTSDVQEPPDGLLRELFVQGSDCVIASGIPAPDKYSSQFAQEYYRRYHGESVAPEVITTAIVEDGTKNGRHAQSYGIFFPIYYSVR